MVNKSIIDYSERCFSNNEKFKFATSFVEKFNVNIQSFYTTSEYFTIEFDTEDNCGELQIADDEIRIEHNVFDDFVEMRKYIKNYFEPISE